MAVKDRNLRQARTTPPDVIDHVFIRFPMCHFL